MKALYRLLYYLSILLTSILAGFTLAGAFAGDASPDGFKPDALYRIGSADTFAS